MILQLHLFMVGISKLDVKFKEDCKYFIQYRFTKKQHIDQWSSPKAKLEDLFFNLHEKLDLEKISRRRRFVPHITLVPPFKTNNVEEMIRSLDNRFKVENPNPKEIYFSFRQANILPFEKIDYLVVLADASEDLADLNKKIKGNTVYNKLANAVYTPSFGGWNPHIEIGDSTQISDLSRAKFLANNYLEKENLIGIKEPVSRITIMEKRNKQTRILLEYDFIRKEWLNRYEALSNKLWIDTAREIDKIYKKINNI